MDENVTLSDQQLFVSFVCPKSYLLMLSHALGVIRTHKPSDP
jgi:hypothetical protein